MSRLARWSILTPFLVSLLVPIWLLLADYLGYEIFFMPEPQSPRFPSAVLGATFYIVWWPLFLLFIAPGSFVTHPIIHFVPDGPLRFAVSGVAAGVVYSLVLYLLWRGIFRRGTGYA